MRRRMLLPQSEMYLTIISAADNNTIGWKCNNASIAKTIQVSTDNGVSWTAVTSTTSGATLATLGIGKSLLLKGANSAYGSVGNTNMYNYITSTGQFDVLGNIMSMVAGDSFSLQTKLTANAAFFAFFISSGIRNANNLILPNNVTAHCYRSLFGNCAFFTTAPKLPAKSSADYCYYCMFNNCPSLTQAPSILPAMRLNQYCYYGMFQNCTSLTQAPVLPATRLHYHCYRYMFKGCTSLTAAPALPAEEMSHACYYEMFSNCTALSQPPALPATKLANSCYAAMFQGCTSLTQAPALPATKLVGTCYGSMFYGCSKLTEAPELPATIAVDDCYYNMFRNCTTITQAPELPATTLGKNCYRCMFLGCTKLLTTPKTLPATTLKSHCYNGMFQRCTSLTTAPELPAVTLVDNCYNGMFWWCASLRTIKCLATNISATNCVSQWVYRVPSSCVFTKHPAMTTWPNGIDGIPANCTVLEAVQITVTYTSGNSGAYLKEIGTNDVMHTFIDGEPYEAELDDAKTYGVYDSNDNLIETLATPFSRLNSITI